MDMSRLFQFPAASSHETYPTQYVASSRLSEPQKLYQVWESIQDSQVIHHVCQLMYRLETSGCNVCRGVTTEGFKTQISLN